MKDYTTTKISLLPLFIPAGIMATIVFGVGKFLGII